MKVEFIGYNNRHTAYILQEFNSQKVIKACNVIFKQNEIQSFSAKETINPKNPILASPNMNVDNDRSNGKNTKIPVQDRVGEKPVVENQNEVEENPKEDVALPRESRNRHHHYAFNITKEENVQNHFKPKTGEKLSYSNRQSYLDISG